MDAFTIYGLPALAALGFVLGYFYTRTMRLSEQLPSEYVNKAECKSDRDDCAHYRERDRSEIIERVVRIEKKLDRIIEALVTR